MSIFPFNNINRRIVKYVSRKYLYQRRSIHNYSFLSVFVQYIERLYNFIIYDTWRSIKNPYDVQNRRLGKITDVIFTSDNVTKTIDGS